MGFPKPKSQFLCIKCFGSQYKKFINSDRISYTYKMEFGNHILEEVTILLSTTKNFSLCFTISYFIKYNIFYNLFYLKVFYLKLQNKFLQPFSIEIFINCKKCFIAVFTFFQFKLSVLSNLKVLPKKTYSKQLHFMTMPLKSISMK